MHLYIFNPEITVSKEPHQTLEFHMYCEYMRSTKKEDRNPCAYCLYLSKRHPTYDRAASIFLLRNAVGKICGVLYLLLTGLSTVKLLKLRVINYCY